MRDWTVMEVQACALPIFALALAIGSNAAVFSVVNGVLLRPLPFAEQDRLFMLAEQSRQGAFRPPSYPTFLDWRGPRPGVSRPSDLRGGGGAAPRPRGGTENPPPVALPRPFFAPRGG